MRSGTKLRPPALQALAVTADLENYSGADSAMAQALERFGRIDILVNNVGGTIWAKPYAEYREPEIEAEVRRSLFPTLWCCRAVLPAMLKQGGGVIVNVSSVATRGVNRVPYAAAKGGVNALTASLAFEYAEHGIRVVGTAPGGTEAPPRRVPRNPTAQDEREKVWYQGIVDQTISSSFLMSATVRSRSRRRRSCSWRPTRPRTSPAPFCRSPGVTSAEKMARL